ncbi:MAG: rod shape-determining protein MreC [Candidatus Moranbacteria bacterium]|nr:rod shape-determining protein MreC [Candidatus Moranbacteria bacterium]
MTFFSRKNIKFLSIVFILLILIFVSFRGADNPLKGFVLSVSSPFLKTFRIFSGGMSDFFNFLGTIGDLKDENGKMIQKNQELLAENARLKDIEKENGILREEFGLAPKNKFDLEASFVVAQDPQGLGNYIIVDKGSNKGIKTGMPAVISDGILIGRVTDVYSNTAKITLITDPASAINAEVQDSSSKGIVNGEYGLGIKMNMISQAQEIKEGDLVVTSGLGGEMPRGLVIGKISRINQSKDKLFQEASVLPEANFSDLRIIFVVKKF